MAITVSVESPLQEDVRGLVAHLNAHLQPLSPREFQFQLTVEQMAGSDTTVFIARNPEGKAVGMGAIKVHDDAFGEVKRMYTDPSERRSGVGNLVLKAIEDAARQKGLAKLRLETGGTPGFEPTWAFYEQAGFTRCGVFADYPDTEFNVFYEKTLS